MTVLKPPPRSKRPSPPGIRTEKIKVTSDGKEVDLEDVFETFNGIFDNLDDVFENMEKAFSISDKDISIKINELKKKLAAKHSDKYEYIPADGEDMGFEDEFFKKRRSSAVREVFHQFRQRRILTRATLIVIPVMLLVFAVWFLVSITNEDKSELGAPTKMSEQSKPEVLEKL